MQLKVKIISEQGSSALEALAALLLLGAVFGGALGEILLLNHLERNIARARGAQTQTLEARLEASGQ